MWSSFSQSLQVNRVWKWPLSFRADTIYSSNKLIKNQRPPFTYNDVLLVHLCGLVMAWRSSSRNKSLSHYFRYVPPSTVVFIWGWLHLFGSRSKCYPFELHTILNVSYAFDVSYIFARMVKFFTLNRYPHMLCLIQVIIIDAQGGFYYTYLSEKHVPINSHGSWLFYSF